MQVRAFQEQASRPRTVLKVQPPAEVPSTTNYAVSDSECCATSACTVLPYPNQWNQATREQQVSSRWAENLLQLSPAWTLHGRMSSEPECSKSNSCRLSTKCQECSVRSGTRKPSVWRTTEETPAKLWTSSRQPHRRGRSSSRQRCRTW